MRFTKYVWVILVIPAFSFAQGWLPVGARSMSLGNATVALEDVWAYHHNPAAMAGLKGTHVGVSYENRFLLKDLQTQGLVIGQQVGKGMLSLGAQFYGHQLYRTNRLGLGYSLKLGELLSAGVQVNYQGVNIRDYGKKGTVTAELGLLAKLNENLHFGFSIFNLNRARFSDFQDDRLATYMRAGLRYQVSKKLMLLAEAEKEVESKIRPKGALEYGAGEKFFLRLAAVGNPMELSFGMGFKFGKQLRLDFGSAWNQLLGWSPHAGLTWQLGKETVEHE
ncbi:MAG: hypothetical protein EP338_05160 [Bacteroidetes bacterium]|nr:MAG: hypothetical protein EP338_05160 [Bacteroidota bacterium]